MSTENDDFDFLRVDLKHVFNKNLCVWEWIKY